MDGIQEPRISAGVARTSEGSCPPLDPAIADARSDGAGVELVGLVVARGGVVPEDGVGQNWFIPSIEKREGARGRRARRALRGVGGKCALDDSVGEDTAGTAGCLGGGRNGVAAEQTVGQKVRAPIDR